jgi:hypothetical protein
MQFAVHQKKCCTTSHSTQNCIHISIHQVLHYIQAICHRAVCSQVENLREAKQFRHSSQSGSRPKKPDTSHQQHYPSHVSAQHIPNHLRCVAKSWTRCKLVAAVPLEPRVALVVRRGSAEVELEPEKQAKRQAIERQSASASAWQGAVSHYPNSETRCVSASQG